MHPNSSEYSQPIQHSISSSSGGRKEFTPFAYQPSSNKPTLTKRNPKHKDEEQQLSSPRSLAPPLSSPDRRAMATDAILETIKPRRSSEQLPVTTASLSPAGVGDGIGLRRRMSSVSAHIGPSLSASIRRAQSMPSVKALAAAGALRRWWEWGIGWVMDRSPPFARGIEITDDEADALGGCHCRGTWRHVLYKVRAGARRLLGRDGRPLRAAATHGFRYDSVSYAQNFDDGEA